MLKFLSTNATSQTINKPLSIDSLLVLLKKWNPLIDATREKIGNALTWVHFPGLPPQYWSMDVFRCIGNKLGQFVGVDMSFESSGRVVIERIIVNMDTREGFYFEINVSHRGVGHKQIFYFEGYVPLSPMP